MFLKSLWNRKASSCSWSESGLGLGWNRAPDPPLESVKHLKKYQKLVRYVGSSVILTFQVQENSPAGVAPFTELLLPVVFNKVVSGHRWCVRRQSGNAAVDEKPSWIRTSVWRLEGQGFSKIKGAGEQLGYPVTLRYTTKRTVTAGMPRVEQAMTATLTSHQLQRERRAPWELCWFGEG